MEVHVIPRSMFRFKFKYKCNKVQRLDDYQNECIVYIEVEKKLLTVCSRAGKTFKGTKVRKRDQQTCITRQNVRKVKVKT